MAPSTPTEQEPPPESESERFSRELSEALAEAGRPSPWWFWALAGLCVVALYAVLLWADREERAGRGRPTDPDDGARATLLVLRSVSLRGGGRGT